jgi:catechol 2,3-dioxygenase|tara:strand:- start:261 stop:530 length:270 start_codon:yes stop_codon:yes gene_type:complete
LTSGRTHHELLLIKVGSLRGPTPGPPRGFYHAGFCIGQDTQALRDARDELIDADVTINGACDHGITQSLYLLDPDGNEIEIYVDDPNVD